MKDSFILFTEYKEQVDMLTDEQAGILLKAIFCYSAGEDLPPMDAITKMAFSFIRSAMDRADDKYQRKIEANRENGRRGGSLDLLIELAITFDVSLDYLVLGRVKYSDSERIRRELETIMGQIGQLKASL